MTYLSRAAISRVIARTLAERLMRQREALVFLEQPTSKSKIMIETKLIS